MKGLQITSGQISKALFTSGQHIRMANTRIERFCCFEKNSFLLLLLFVTGSDIPKRFFKKICCVYHLLQWFFTRVRKQAQGCGGYWCDNFFYPLSTPGYIFEMQVLFGHGLIVYLSIFDVWEYGLSSSTQIAAVLLTRAGDWKEY